MNPTKMNHQTMTAWIVPFVLKGDAKLYSNLESTVVYARSALMAYKTKQ